MKFSQLLLSSKLLWRNWRGGGIKGGEVKILAGSLALAVAVVTAIAVFSSRMEQSLVRQSNTYLAADRVISSRFSIPNEWQEALTNYELTQSTIVEFSSMVFAASSGEEFSDDMQLASVKAVGESYPLRGQLEISDTPFAEKDKITIAQDIPAQGEVWVDSRLLPLMNLSLGDSLAVGNKDFTISSIVIREPDGTNGFSVLGPRVLMNVADLDATGVVQPGSRVDYRWLVAGEESILRDFEAWIKPLLGEHYRFITIKNSQRSISSALDRGTRFLMLAAIIGVLLASVAIAIASQQFARNHVDQVALLKSLGASSTLVRRLYLYQMLQLGILASFVGIILGEFVQRFIALTLSSLLNIQLASAAFSVYFTGLATGMLCLLCFALPPLWHLPKVSPLKILRRELVTNPVSAGIKALLGVGAIIGLISFYSGDVNITLSVVSGFGIIIIISMALAFSMLRYSHRLGSRAGSYWRLALSNLQRYRSQSMVQILVFSCALMLLMVLYAVRTNLIEEWRLQLPEDAPNHFMLNIAPYEKDAIQTLFVKNELETNPIYPMVLGRIAAINNIELTEEDRRASNSLRRELNLSWAEQMAPDNSLVEGEWWEQWQSTTGLPGISVEYEEAQEIGLQLGDVVTFTLGGLSLQAEVASFRTVDWNAMTPNFFFLFSPGALDKFTVNYLTSVHIPREQKNIINQLLREYPTIVVIEVDRIIERIRKIVTQVSQGIELVLWLVLIGGVLVLVAAVNASMATRMQESGLLRALGSGRKLILSSIAMEFMLLGLFSGILGVFGAEALLFGLQYVVFDGNINPHYELWLAGPLLGAFLIGVLGLVSCQRVVSVPPNVVLRDIEA